MRRAKHTTTTSETTIYDPAKGGYIQPDPAGLSDGVGTYSYVSNMPVEYWNSIGKGKEGGQPNIGGNDELIDKSIGKHSTSEQ